MAMAIGGLAVFVLLVVGVIGYAIRYRPPKVEKTPGVPAEADLRLQEWRRVRSRLSYGTRWTLFWTNRRGLAAPRELAELGALRAEAMLIVVEAIGRAQQAGRSRRWRAGWLLATALYFALFGLFVRSWWMTMAVLAYAYAGIGIVREPARATSSRRRLTRALFANHALIDSDLASSVTVPAEVQRASE